MFEITRKYKNFLYKIINYITEKRVDDLIMLLQSYDYNLSEMWYYIELIKDDKIHRYKNEIMQLLTIGIEIRMNPNKKIDTYKEVISYLVGD